MYRISLSFFCIFNVIVVSCATKCDFSNDISNFDHPYDIQGLYRRLYSSLNLKDKLPNLANNIHFNAIDEEFLLENLAQLSQNSSKCVKDILYTFESVTNISNQWSWKFFDSFAKPESGILLGNFKWVGEYNECINVYAPPKAHDSSVGNYYGQYCSLTYKLSLYNQSFPLSFGICLPDSCSPKDIQNDIIDLFFKAGGYPVSYNAEASNSSVTITCKPRERYLSTAAICVIALISIFCGLALAGSSITAVKYFKKIFKDRKGGTLIINISDQEHTITDSQNVPKKISEPDVVLLVQSDGSNGFLDSCASFLSSFCVFTNGSKLLNTDSSEGQLLCIHGIRFLSMSWVILGHAYMFGALETRNIIETGNVLNEFLFQVVLQGFFSVDSFFVLSGFLLTYLSMTEFSKTEGSINWIYFYIHRYIRLTPIYMIILGFSATIYLYLGSGPFWPMGDSDPLCEKSWYKNLLYINNFNEMNEQCVGWSWYLANDMQFFVISPIFLITLWRWPIIGYSLLALFLAACMATNFIITYQFDLPVGLVGLGVTGLDSSGSFQIMAKFTDFFSKLYIKPYARIGPYLTGIIVGYIVFKHKSNNKPKLKWVYLCVGWIVASAVTLTIVYGLYKAHPSLISRSFFNAFNRTCFGFGLSWVIYVCLTNQSGIVDRILSYKFFIPLSRLTYSAYLIHPMIITGYYASIKRPVEFSHSTVVLLFLGFMVVTYALALPVSLILESPIVSLEKVIRNKFKKIKKTESAN